MPIFCVGLSHQTAPLAVREQFSLGPSREHVIRASGALHDAGVRCGLSEVALLSTCNRTEVYAAAADPASRFTRLPDGAAELLARVCQTPARLEPSHVYHRLGSAALEHLCMVAAGLDSMVIGESEVLGQVDEARRVSLESGSAGRILDAAFRTAVRAGRRARAETRIGRRPASVASEALRWIHERFGALTDANVLVVGTGNIARLAGEMLRSSGAGLAVVGRTHDHTFQLSERLGAASVPWHGLAAAIQRADIVLSTTAAPHAVISRELVVDVLAERAPGRRLLFADLAVPRDIDPGVSELPGVELLNLDVLHTRIEANLMERSRETPGVRTIIEEEMAHFETWRTGARLRPVLTGLHQMAETIRQREVERAMARMPTRDEESRQRMEALSHALVAKLLASPSRRLRAEPDPRKVGEWSVALAGLFGLDPATAGDQSRDGT